jgi:hypothetical protein
MIEHFRNLNDTFKPISVNKQLRKIQTIDISIYLKNVFIDKYDARNANDAYVEFSPTAYGFIYFAFFCFHLKGKGFMYTSFTFCFVFVWISFSFSSLKLQTKSLPLDTTPEFAYINPYIDT